MHIHMGICAITLFLHHHLTKSVKFLTQVYYDLLPMLAVLPLLGSTLLHKTYSLTSVFLSIQF